MARTQCIITGCGLLLQHGRDRAWGDLHVQGDRFIFNGVTNREGQMHWTNPHPALDDVNTVMALVIPIGEEYFERRGVLICRAARELLSLAAQEYVARSPHSFDWWRTT